MRERVSPEDSKSRSTGASDARAVIRDGGTVLLALVCNSGAAWEVGRLNGRVSAAGATDMRRERGTHLAVRGLGRQHLRGRLGR